MWGAIIGDIVGSVYAFDGIRTKKFEFFDVRGHFSDETVLTCAVAQVMREYVAGGKKLDFAAELQEAFLDFGWKYPDLTYGRNFIAWLFADEQMPYASAGVGCAVRVSPAAWYAKTLEEAEEYARMSCVVTHTHEASIHGAKAMAAAIFMARQHLPKEEIKRYLEEHYYKLTFTLADIRRGYQFNPTCPGAIPPALVAFLEAEDFEDAVRNAISIGGGDALAALTGSIAEAYFGIPEEMKERARMYLDETLLAAVE
ncbi:MAG: ADP-ribosylglycohydrolase family protein [Acidaminococcaceae bacterium]